MLLWTIKPEEVYEEIMSRGVYHCDARKASIRYFSHLQYKWLASQMRKRIGKPPRGVSYPVWTWQRWNGERMKPDLRAVRWYWGMRNTKFFRLEIEIPDDEVLLSDFDSWSVMLNNGLLADTEEEAEVLDRIYDSLTQEAKIKMRDKNWERVFNITPFNNGWTRNGETVQATFWELRKEQIREVKMFVSSSKYIA